MAHLSHHACPLSPFTQVVNALARMLMALRDVPAAQRPQLPQKPVSSQPPQQLTPQQQQHFQRVQQAQLQQLQQLQKEATGLAGQGQPMQGQPQQVPAHQAQFALRPHPGVVAGNANMRQGVAPENVVINLAPPGMRMGADAARMAGDGGMRVAADGARMYPGAMAGPQMGGGNGESVIKML